MDRRLTVLATRFDVILPTLATKADIDSLRAESRIEFEKLRTDGHKMIADSMKWMNGLVVSLFLGVLGMNIAMLTTMKSLVENRQAVATAAPAASSAARPSTQPHP